MAKIINNLVKKIFISVLAGLGVLVLPGIILAQGDQITPLLCNLAKEIYKAAFWAIIICWVVVTILFLTVFNSPERANIAKKSIAIAIIGTVIIFFGAVSLKIIENTLGVFRGGGDVCGGALECPLGEHLGTDGVCTATRGGGGEE